MPADQDRGTYARSINAAAAASPGGTAEDILDLAAALFKGQKKFIKKNELVEEESSSRSSSNGSGGSGSRSKYSGKKSFGPPTVGGSEKQVTLYENLVEEIEGAGEEPEWSLKQLHKLSGKPLSEAIGELIEQSKGLNG